MAQKCKIAFQNFLLLILHVFIGHTKGFCNFKAKLNFALLFIFLTKE